MRAQTIALAIGLIPLLTGCRELSQLRERTEIQQRELARLRGELNQWQTSYNDLRTQHEAEVARREERIQAVQSEVTRLQTRQSEHERMLESQVAQLQQQLQLANTELSTRTAESQTLSQRLSAAEGERETLRSQVTQINEDLSTLDQMVNSEQTNRQQAEQQASDLNERLRQIAAQLEARDAEIAQLREALAQEQSAERAPFTEPELERIATYLGQTMESVSGGLRAQVEQSSRRGVILTLSNEDLFESGSTVVKSSAIQSLTALGYALQQLPEVSILVVGHTDNEPIRNLPFLDNWQLSASRAENVMRILLEDGQVPPERIRYAGGGEHHPIRPNSTTEGRAANRRVEIIVAPDRPAE